MKPQSLLLEWGRFATKAFAGAEPERLRNERVAFYAGAASILTAIAQMSGADPAEAVAVLQRLDGEAREFLDRVANDCGGHGGA
jgi:hypothetical protein